jgi:hypothetical protein
MSDLLNQLIEEEKAACFRFVDKQLEKGTSLAGIRLLLEKKGYDRKVARELVKEHSLKHAKKNLNKAYLSIGIGTVVCGVILVSELSHSGHMKFEKSFFYGLGSLISGIGGFLFFFKRYNYLRKLD